MQWKWAVAIALAVIIIALVISIVVVASLPSKSSGPGSTFPIPSSTQVPTRLEDVFRGPPAEHQTLPENAEGQIREPPLEFYSMEELEAVVPPLGSEHFGAAFSKVGDAVLVDSLHVLTLFEHRDGVRRATLNFARSAELSDFHIFRSWGHALWWMREGRSVGVCLTNGKRIRLRDEVLASSFRRDRAIVAQEGVLRIIRLRYTDGKTLAETSLELEMKFPQSDPVGVWFAGPKFMLAFASGEMATYRTGEPLSSRRSPHGIPKRAAFSQTTSHLAVAYRRHVEILREADGYASVCGTRSWATWVGDMVFITPTLLAVSAPPEEKICVLDVSRPTLPVVAEHTYASVTYAGADRIHRESEDTLWLSSSLNCILRLKLARTSS